MSTVTHLSTSCYKCGKIVSTRDIEDCHSIEYVLNHHWENDKSCIREEKLRDVFGEKLPPNAQEFFKRKFNYTEWLERVDQNEHTTK